MGSESKYYLELLKKLEGFIRKDYLQFLLFGIQAFIAAVLLNFTFYSFLELIANFNSVIRTVLFILFILLALGLLFFFLVKPILKFRGLAAHTRQGFERGALGGNLAAVLLDQHPAGGDEVLGHGRTDSEHQNDLDETGEAALIRDVTEAITRFEGQPPRGWLSPGVNPSAVTPDLLQEAGYTYLLDWPMDDQPVWTRTRAGPILSVPYPIELNDSQVVIHRKQDASHFCDMVVEQFDEMVEQSARHPSS